MPNLMYNSCTWGRRTFYSSHGNAVGRALYQAPLLIDVQVTNVLDYCCGKVIGYGISPSLDCMSDGFVYSSHHHVLNV